MADRIRKKTKYLTVSAMLCALGTVCLMLGALIDVLDITVSVLASLFCLYAVIEIGGAYPWGIYAATSILSLVLLPVKTPALFYAAFAGFYPILKQHVERLPKLPMYLLKLLIFHASFGIIALAFRLFLSEELQSDSFFWLPLLLYLASLLTFCLYDLALSRVITFYRIRLHSRFRIK